MAAKKMIEKIGEEKYLRMLAYNRKYRKENREKVGIWDRRKTAILKKRVFDSYGGECCRCGFKDIRALQIDHINGVPSGMRRMKQNPHRGGRVLYQAIHSGKVNFKDFQLLCANCNWIKRHEKKEFNHINYGKDITSSNIRTYYINGRS